MSTIKKEDEYSPERNAFDRRRRQKEEEEYWTKRRAKRERYAARGVDEVWGLSPTHDELRRIYEEHEEAAKRVAEEARRAEKEEKQRLKEAKKRKLETTDSDSSSSSTEKRKRKKKSKKEKKSKSKKEKRSKKKHKRSRVSSSSSSSSSEVNGKNNDDEWVEVTRDMRLEQAQKEREEEAQMIGPQIPDYLIDSNQPDSSNYFDGKLDAKDRKNMLRGEAAAMAAYAAQGKRIPRRGEIGLSSNEIATFEDVGYVMSGTRHKSMEATRLRKENQILTAEEKRLLSGFNHEQRKEKEDLVMQQFQNLISSKRAQ
ncbi:Nkap-C domain-containing protein [Aphelenchoides besseyi]|nr:Nkap-C domain-containing protein [Aphelenchoides besseyi]